jgi:hypothetical protein
LACVCLWLCWWQLPTSLRRLRRWLVSDWVRDAPYCVVPELVSATATSRPVHALAMADTSVVCRRLAARSAGVWVASLACVTLGL